MGVEEGGGGERWGWGGGGPGCADGGYAGGRWEVPYARCRGAVRKRGGGREGSGGEAGVGGAGGEGRGGAVLKLRPLEHWAPRRRRTQRAAPSAAVMVQVGQCPPPACRLPRLLRRRTTAFHPSLGPPSSPPPRPSLLPAMHIAFAAPHPPRHPLPNCVQGLGFSVPGFPCMPSSPIPPTPPGPHSQLLSLTLSPPPPDPPCTPSPPLGASPHQPSANRHSYPKYAAR